MWYRADLNPLALIRTALRKTSVWICWLSLTEGVSSMPPGLCVAKLLTGFARKCEKVVLLLQMCLFFQPQATECGMRVTIVQVRSEGLEWWNLKLDPALERENPWSTKCLFHSWLTPEERAAGISFCRKWLQEEGSWVRLNLLSRSQLDPETNSVQQEQQRSNEINQSNSFLENENLWCTQRGGACQA